MKITKIESVNFRNFKAKCSITFPTDGSVTIIYGPNGVGKTTLHQLFQWIFYGEVHFNKTASKEMYNLEFEQNARIGSNFTVSGMIDFEHPNRNGAIEKYSILRKWIYRKELKDSKVVERSIRISKDASISDKDSNWVTITSDSNEAAKLIEQILPSGLSQYFFFDGESMIADLGRTGKESAKSLKNALYSIFDLDIYEQAAIHIGSQKAGSSTVLGKLYLNLVQDSNDANIAKLKGDYNLYILRVRKAKDEIEKCNNILEKYHKEAQELSEKIGGTPSRKSLESNRKRLKEYIKSSEEAIDREVKAFGTTVMSVYPYLFISRVVEDAQYRIGLKIEDQKLPQGLSKELVLTLLKMDTCLCGNPITDRERFCLKEWEKMFPPLSYKYIYDQFKISASRWAATYDKDALKNHITYIFKQKDQIDKLLQDIHKIDEELKQSGNVDDLIDMRTKLEEDIRSAQFKLSSLQQELGVKQKLKSQLEAKIDKALAASSTNKVIKNQIDVMEVVKQYFETKLTTAASKYSSDLGLAIQELLDEILLARRFVEMTPEFELSVKDSYGNEAKSEGQFAIVSFAYIGGIFKLLKGIPELKGKEFPLVLDGPFSKLDAEHRQKVIDKLPTYAPQIILFSKDDINKCFDSLPPENIWTIYSNEERNVSFVKHGYDPEVFVTNANGSDK